MLFGRLGTGGHEDSKPFERGRRRERGGPMATPSLRSLSGPCKPNHHATVCSPGETRDKGARILEV